MLNTISSSYNSKSRRYKDNDYIEWVRGLPCIVCLILMPTMNTSNIISDPHHVNKQGHGTMAGKTDDNRCVPLCHRHHVEYHNIGKESFKEKYEVDFEAVIDRLNTIYKERKECMMSHRSRLNGSYLTSKG